MGMEKTFSGGSQLLTNVGVPADDFIRTKKYTRVYPACIFEIRGEPQGFVALAAAGVTDEPAAGFLVEAVARPGLLSVSTISFVKSTVSGAYSTTGTPLMLIPDLSNTKSRFLVLTFSMTTSVISFTIPSRIRINCSCN